MIGHFVAHAVVAVFVCLAAVGICPRRVSLMRQQYGDLDGDGSVGFTDFLDLLKSWGRCVDRCCLADLDGDLTVNVVDFLLLLDNWTVTAPTLQEERRRVRSSSD